MTISATLRVAVALGLVAPLTACGGVKSGAETAVRDSLKDPDSARFGELYFNEKTQKGCLTVNAKNSMGGYTGDQQAYVQRAKDGWTVIGIVELPLKTCRKIYADSAS